MCPSLELGEEFLFFPNHRELGGWGGALHKKEVGWG